MTSLGLREILKELEKKLMNIKKDLKYNLAFFIAFNTLSIDFYKKCYGFII